MLTKLRAIIRLVFKELIFQNKMATEKNIKLNSTKQLIDLNGEKVNFILHFEVESEENKPFYATVITQKLLDSDTEPQFKHITDGGMNVDIKNDNGVYENYLLLLKSDESVNCKVIIDIKDAPLNPQIEKDNTVRQQQMAMRRREEERIRNPVNSDTKVEIPKEGQGKFKLNFKTILLVIVIIVGGALLWFFYFKKKTLSKAVLEPDFNVQSLNPLPVAGVDENILTKINNIPLW